MISVLLTLLLITLNAKYITFKENIVHSARVISSIFILLCVSSYPYLGNITHLAPLLVFPDPLYHLIIQSQFEYQEILYIFNKPFFSSRYSSIFDFILVILFLNTSRSLIKRVNSFSVFDIFHRFWDSTNLRERRVIRMTYTSNEYSWQRLNLTSSVVPCFHQQHPLLFLDFYSEMLLVWHNIRLEGPMHERGRT